MNNQWAPIDQYSDSALARMSRNSGDMRSEAAKRELDRRRKGTAARAIDTIGIANDTELCEMHIAALDALYEAQAEYAAIVRELQRRGAGVSA